MLANSGGCTEALENKHTIALAEEHRVLQEKLSDLTDEEIQKELYRAVGDNDVNKARLLLSQIKNVHVTKKYDPLFKAINDENERMVMLLVSNSKTDVNTIGGAGQTPLNYALFREDKVNVTIVWTLLSRLDIDVNGTQGDLFAPIQTSTETW